MQDAPQTKNSSQTATKNLALVMSGGGARAAYQVGLLRCMAEQFPNLRIPILTGISAGAINAAYLANSTAPFAEAVHDLADLWCNLSPDKVFRVDAFSLLKNVFNWGYHLLSGAFSKSSRVRGLVDTEPLRNLLIEAMQPREGELAGIGMNLESGALEAVAISTTDYASGNTVIWTQGCDVHNWNRPKRESFKTRLTIDHIMASTAIPIFFPATQINGAWHGDGGIRLYAPLSPAIHLGANRILAISTRYENSGEARNAVIEGYPPPAQIAGVLMNSIFLDTLSQDADRLERTNRLLREIPVEKRNGRRVIDQFILRPSVDLGKLAAQFEPRLPPFFRFLMRKQGSRETSSPDWLSMVMFQSDYLQALIELGEKDARNKKSELQAFLS